MENQKHNTYHLTGAVFFLTILFFSSCNKWTVPPDLTGQWTSEKTEITVRIKPEPRQYQFIKDSAFVKFTVYDNKTASGSIGAATFENMPLKRNPGNVERKGIEFIINCGPVGKIFESDPLEDKEVQLWLAPLKGDTLDVELRFTEGMAHFPMAGIKLIKEGDE